MQIKTLTNQRETVLIAVLNGESDTLEEGELVCWSLENSSNAVIPLDSPHNGFRVLRCMMGNAGDRAPAGIVPVGDRIGPGQVGLVQCYGLHYKVRCTGYAPANTVVFPSSTVPGECEFLSDALNAAASTPVSSLVGSVIEDSHDHAPLPYYIGAVFIRLM